jgi:hypothetical protein
VYNARDLLSLIDQHRVPVLALCAVAMIGNYIFFIEAYRVSRREKIFTIPIFCTMFWFAHDLSFVYRYDLWWNQIDHWYVKAFWFALVLTVTFESIYLRQVVKYGGRELLPEASQAQWTALVGAGVIGAIVCWEAVKFVFDDDLYAGSFGIANLSYVLMGTALAVHRRSMRGQTPMIWVGYLLLAVCWSTANFLFFGPAFRSPQWVALSAACVLGGIGLLYASVRWPAPSAARRAEAQLV